MKGVQRADSVTWNPHKLMGVILQCSALLVKHKVQINAEYYLINYHIPTVSIFEFKSSYDLLLNRRLLLVITSFKKMNID